MANRMELQFKGWEDVIDNLRDMEKDVNKAVENALNKSKEYVTQNAISAISPHHRSGKTEGSIDEDYRVSWKGGIAETEVGFHIRQGGLPSIFLMYGTPRMNKDQKLYDAFYGRKTEKEVGEIQKNELLKVLEGKK